MIGHGTTLDTLFDEWESAYRDKFQRDSIVDEEKYRDAPWRILFLTKEANNVHEDMREQARDATDKLARRGTHGYAYWRTLARWSYSSVGLRSLSRSRRTSHIPGHYLGSP
jgi:hypothetical protein